MEPKRQIKKIFFTSDIHEQHDNVILYDKRPFKDVDHMSRVLINNYNSTVPEDGICYFLGDIGMCKSNMIQKFINQLNNSTKVLILGNHDRGPNSMYECGFDVVLNSAVMYIGKHRVSMSHCPLPGIFREDVTNMKGAKEGEHWHGEQKNQMFTSQDLTVDYHLHGHIHSGPANNKLVKTNKQFDIGCAGNKYKPVSIKEVESWISLEERKKLNNNI